MRKLFSVFTLTAVIAMTITSCSKDEDFNNNNNTTNNNNNNTTATCSDGIKNGDETGVDCGGSCPTCPPAAITKKFYVQVKVDGAWVTAQQDDIPHNTSGYGMQTQIVQGAIFYFDISLVPATTGKIEALEGTSVDAGSNTGLLFGFGSIISGVDRNVFAATQNGGVFNITEITADGTYSGFPSYLAKGNFNCNLAQNGGANQVSLTDGIFAIKMVAID